MSEIKLHSVNIFDTDGVKVSWQFQFDGVIPDSNSGTTPYLYPEDVRVQELYTDANGIPQVIDRVGTLTAANEIRVEGTPIAAGRQVRIYRATEIRFPLVDYRDRQVVSELDLDLQARQSLFVAMEVYDAADQATDASARAEQVAGTALATANAAVVTADAADQKADNAVLAANSAVQTSGEAFDLATLAREEAAAAEAHADQVEVRADEAAQAAERAETASVAAQEAAEEAIGIASAVDGKATSALQNSEAALDVANGAAQVAAAIDGKASQALADSSEALSTANAASNTANAVDGKAQTALDNSAAAVQTADAATLAVASVRTDLTATQLRVTNTETRLTAEEAATFEHNTRLVGLRTDVDALRTDVTALQNLNLPVVPTAMSAADNVVLALVDGTLWSTMGNGEIYGQVAVGRGGDGTVSSSAQYGLDRFQRVTLPSTSPVTKAFTNGKNSYALLANGDLYAWGINAFGQLGLGHTAITGIPTLSAQNVLDFYGDPTNAAYDGSASKMYIRKAEGILAAGYNGYGQLGTGGTANSSSWVLTFPTASGTPRLVFNLGASHGVGVILTTDNRMMVCGRNDTGALGTGNGANVQNWTNVTANWGGATFVAQITRCSGGFGHSDTAGYGNSWMAAYASGVGVRVSGFGRYGAIGNGSTANVTVSNNVALPSLPIDFVHTGDAPGSLFILGTDRNIYAWGYNNTDGQTGLGLTGITATVQKVTLPGTVAKIITRGASAYGYGYAAAMIVQLNDGNYWGWGNNRAGGVATGDGGSVITPRRALIPGREVDGSVMVPVMHFQLACDQGGVQTNFILAASGYIYGWGYNARHLLSYSPVTANERVPIRITPPWRRKG